MKVAVVSVPHRMHYFRAMSKHFPKKIETKIISSKTATKHHIPSLDLFNQLTKFSPDIIYTDYPLLPSWNAKIYSHFSKKNVRLIVRLRGDWWQEFNSRIKQPSLRHLPFYPLEYITATKGISMADRIVPICKWLEKRVNQKHPRIPTDVLYQGIDPAIFSKAESFNFKPNSVGLVQDYNVLPKVEGLIKFKSVMKKMSDVNFYLAGAGPYLDYAKAKLKLHNVHFIGRVSYPEGLKRFFSSIDAYVLASGLDCCPTTILEAGLMEKPVVASNVGGIPEIIEEGKTGFVVDNGNDTLWEKRIRTLLEDQSVSKKIGKTGAKYVKQNFSWQVLSKKLIEIFSKEVK